MKVMNNSLQRHIKLQTMPYTINLMILLELNMYPAHTHKNMTNTNIYVDYNDM